MAGPLTLRTLRQHLGQELEDIVVSVTTAAGDTDDIFDTTELPGYKDGNFVDQWFRSNDVGASANEVRFVQTFTQSTGKLRLRTALSAALAIGGEFELHRRFMPTQKDWAIKRALQDAWPEVHNPIVDRSLTAVADQYVYTLPATIQDRPPMIDLEQESGENKPPERALERWRWFRDGATAKVEFAELPTVDRVLRIRHMGVLTEPTETKITSSSIANPSVITTAAAHGLTTGDTVTIEGHAGSTPAVDGDYVVTVTAATTFTILLNVTSGGTGGVVFRKTEVYTREEPIILAAAALNLYTRAFASATGTGREQLKEDVGYWENQLGERKAMRAMNPLMPTQHHWSNIR